MYHSLKRFMADANLVILAVDKESMEVLEALKLNGVKVIPAAELEDAELKELKKHRNESEYCWTLKPVLLLHLYKSCEDVEIFAYLDTDILFFDNPMKLFKNSRSWSVLFTTHKVNRKANGGFVAFMRGRWGYEALKWWREKCLEWCFSRNDSGRFADQGYLDFMRHRFKGVLYLDLHGANVATWNYFKYDIAVKNGQIYVDRNRLIFYHFSGLRLKRKEGSTILYGAEMPCPICAIYSKALRNAISEIEEVDEKITECFYLGL